MEANRIDVIGRERERKGSELFRASGGRGGEATRAALGGRARRVPATELRSTSPSLFTSLGPTTSHLYTQ